MPTSDAQIVHSSHSRRAAEMHARTDRLPLGTEITVTDISGTDHRYEIRRSILSHGMRRGGEVVLRSVDEAQKERLPEGVHVIHATSAQEAADLFAVEMGNHLTSSTIEVDTRSDFSNPQEFDVHPTTTP